MLDRVATVVLGLDGRGNAAMFADYSQWERWMRESDSESQVKASAAGKQAGEAQPAQAKKKLSYLEAREYSGIEERVEAAGERVRLAHAAIEDPAVATDPAALIAALSELEQAQAEADALYARWAELSEKAG
jgi:ATP-binding cassette subfamily F protein uup